MNIARQNLQPAIIPVWTCIGMESGNDVGVVELAARQPGKAVQGKTGQSLGDLHPGRQYLPGGDTRGGGVGSTKPPNWSDMRSSRCRTPD